MQSALVSSSVPVARQSYQRRSRTQKHAPSLASLPSKASASASTFLSGAPQRGSVAFSASATKRFQRDSGRRGLHVAAGDGPEMASEEALKAATSPVVLDVRDAEERADPSREVVPGSVNVPLNMDRQKQSVRATTLDEFTAKLMEARALPEDKTTPIITHCGSGGRGAKARGFLEELGYTNVMNGGTPERINEARGTSSPAADWPTPPEPPRESGIRGSPLDAFKSLITQPGPGQDFSSEDNKEDEGSGAEFALLIVGTTIGTVLLLGVITAFL